MKALITGAGGQVGVQLKRTAPADAMILAVSHAEMDIADPHAVMSYCQRERPEIIFNAAAYTAVDRAEDEPAQAERVNRDGPRNLAMAARETGARLIHLSTDFVFDGSASTPYSPEAKPNPLGVYGATKWAGEQAVMEALPERSVIVRTAWVYAARGANFLKTMLRLMAQDRPVRVVADQVGTPTAAHSLAEVLWQFAARTDISGTFHWTDAGVASWYDLAVAISEEAARLEVLPRESTVIPIATQDYPTRARRPSYSVLDKASTSAALGIAPVHWRKQLRSVLEELRHE